MMQPRRSRRRSRDAAAALEQVVRQAVPSEEYEQRLITNRERLDKMLAEVRSRYR